MSKLFSKITIVFLFIITTNFSQVVSIEEVRCKVPKHEMKDIIAISQFQQDYFKNLFDFETRTIDIKLYGRFVDFKRFRKNVYPTGTTTTGFYSSKLNKIVVNKSDNYIRVMNHEVTHVFMRSIFRYPKKWINEGLAEFFEYCYVFNKAVVIGKQKRRLDKVKELVQYKEIDLHTFLSYSNKEWRKQENSYSISYGLVYFLYKNYPGSIGEILKNLKKGQNSIDALESAFPEGLSKFEEKFKAFFKKTEFDNKIVGFAEINR